MRFAARNVAKVKLGSTSATVARNVTRKVAPCVRTLSHHDDGYRVLPRSSSNTSFLIKTLSTHEDFT